VDGAVVARLMADPFFDAPPPKSLDRDTFKRALDAVAGMSFEDGAATLTAYTVEAVGAAQRFFPAVPERWLICGGGRRNAAMTAGLAARLNAAVEPVEAAGFDGDMLEAQAFAYLAVRVARGLPTTWPETTGCRAPVSGGVIHGPEGA
jgi:anhydro-N-acetylmuramic acid kinase